MYNLFYINIICHFFSEGILSRKITYWKRWNLNECSQTVICTNKNPTEEPGPVMRYCFTFKSE